MFAASAWGAYVAERRGLHGMQLKLPNWRKALGWCLWFLFILFISGLHISMTGRSTTPGRKWSKMVAATHSVNSLNVTSNMSKPEQSDKFTVGLGANLAFEGPSILFSMAEAQFLFRIFKGFGNSKIYKHCLTIFPLEKASLFFSTSPASTAFWTGRAREQQLWITSEDLSFWCAKV